MTKPTKKTDFNKVPKIKKVGGKIYRLHSAVDTGTAKDEAIKNLYRNSDNEVYVKDVTTVKGQTLFYAYNPEPERYSKGFLNKYYARLYKKTISEDIPKNQKYIDRMKELKKAINKKKLSLKG